MKLHYKQYGSSGSPIFILHGIFGMLDNWHNIAKELGNSYQVFTIDARNHGKSPHADEMSYQLMAEDVIELADDLGIDKFILLGHSMGGKTALWTAHQFPERISKLIVADIAPKTYQAGHTTYFKALKNIDWSSLLSRKEIDDALVAYEQNMGIRLFLAKNIERNEAGAFELKCNIDAIEKAYPEIIGGLNFNQINNIPTLFLLGENSNYLKEEDKPFIVSYFKNVTYKTVSNAGHWLHADNPKEFLEKLNSFL
ncbi:MAG: alpha/beta fold hydrolase [Bacteroidota bacterium]|nr:alpha/beta fold hydrolase [Bacteroidota bacterium]